MMRRAFFAFLLLGLSAAGYSFAQGKQTSISGVVRSAEGKPLAKARVYLQPSDGRAPHTAQTDAEGRYKFSNLRPGLYELKAQANGAWTDLVRDVNVNANHEVTVDLKFKAPAAPPAKPQL
jgi:protocatechuate 3,4-dioxygenase beta subunit